VTDKPNDPPADELDPEQAKSVIKAIEEAEKQEAEEQSAGRPAAE
jgi:hypothetical protein